MDGILYLMICRLYMYLCFPKPFGDITSSSVGKISGTLLFDCYVVLKNRCDKKNKNQFKSAEIAHGCIWNCFNSIMKFMKF